MERPILKPIGTPVEELDTPALVVDLDRFRANVEAVHSFFAGRRTKVRPFVGTHRCPTLAHHQLAVDGHAGGVAVGTVGQAEAFVDAGIWDVMITGKAVTAPKIAALCALAGRATVSIAVDSEGNVSDISTAAAARGVEIGLLVELDTGLGLTGVASSDAAVGLAKRISELPGVQMKGLTSYASPSTAGNDGAAALERVVEAREAMAAAGLSTATVAVGSTADYEAAGRAEGVTEVVAGTYALGDVKYEGVRGDIEPAAMVLGTVVSTPVEGVAVGDAGMKTNGNDTGLPRAANVPGATVTYLSAEHFNLDLTDSTVEVGIGDKVWFVPYEIGVTANHFDYIMAARDGRLEGIFEVAARGRYR
ncbi:MAG: alanine racemase [Dehalococcoidia bacterium]|nr:alanine racemase [Dehalococcoidia bacterium]